MTVLPQILNGSSGLDARETINSMLTSTALATLTTGDKTGLTNALNEVNEQVRAYTPSRFGAKGDVRYDRTGSMSAGSTILTSSDAAFAASDVGKTVMIGGAATGPRALTATVVSVQSATQVTLSASAVNAVTNSNMHIGTDDTAALQAWLDACAAAGVVARIPLGRSYLLQQAPLRYATSGTVIEQYGNIVVGNGWGGGFSLCDKIFGTVAESALTSYMGNTKNFFYFGRGGSFILSKALSDDSPGNRRKGIGITMTDDFYVENFRTRGNQINDYFAVQPVHARNGTVVGGYFEHINSGHGSDGIHCYGACSDLLIANVRTFAGDDGSSQTHETVDCLNVTMERITYTNCSFRNIGHSGLKANMNNKVGAAVIQDINYVNCTFVTVADQVGGFGSPIAIYYETQNPSPQSLGAKMRRIRVIGGMSETLMPLNNSASYGNASVRVEDCEGFELIDHTIKVPGYTAVLLLRSDDAVIRGNKIVHTRGPNYVTATPLSVTSIAYQTGNTVRYTFSGDISALGIVATQWFTTTGNANADNNGGFRIETVGANYLDVRNYKRQSATSDEATGTGTGMVARSGDPSISVKDSANPRIEDNRIYSPVGTGAVLLTGVVNNTTQFVDGAIVRNNEFFDLPYGSAIANYNSKNAIIEGNRLRRSPIDMIINEAGSTGAVAGGNRYFDNVDVDGLSARAALLATTIPGKATVHRGNIARLSDSFKGTATQTSGTNTFVIDTSAFNTGPSAEPNGTYLTLEQLAPITSVVYTPANRRFTVTTAANAAANTTWNWSFEQPNF